MARSKSGVNMLARVVLVGADFLDDDGPLGLDLLGSQQRTPDQLAQHGHAPSRLAQGHADPVDRRFAVRGGVEAAATPSIDCETARVVG